MRDLNATGQRMDAAMARDLLNLAGEFRVCSELARHGIFPYLTYGSHKGADVYAISPRTRKAMRIEVKTSEVRQFVTRISQKYRRNPRNAPDFWVCFHLPPEASDNSERFFVLSHAEMNKAQLMRNRTYSRAYKKRHGAKWDFATGVDNVTIEDIARHENRWEKIKDALA